MKRGNIIGLQYIPRIENKSLTTIGFLIAQVMSTNCLLYSYSWQHKRCNKTLLLYDALREKYRIGDTHALWKRKIWVKTTRDEIVGI